MNQTRLLRLRKEDREKYIREELEGMRINELKHFVREYGIHHTKEMGKSELIDVLVDGLCNWAERALNEIYV